MSIFNGLFGSHNNQSINNADEPMVKNQILNTPDTAPNSAPGNSYDFLDSFKSDNWNNASYQERMNAYQALEHHMAQAEGRPERQIVFSDVSARENGAVGYYDPNTDKLYLDEGYINGSKNPFDGMDTVIHEGRHAYQSDCKNGFASPDAKIANNMQGIRDNQAYGNYYGSGIKYFMQPEEYDAHTFANEVMSSPEFTSHLGGEQNYSNYCNAQKAYLDGRTADCEKVAGITRDYAKDDLNNKINKYNELSNNPNASALERENALRDAQNAKANYDKINNDFYNSNGEFDIEKAGNSLARSGAENKSERDKYFCNNPTRAQLQNYNNSAIYPDRAIEPHCTNLDILSNPDAKPGPVSQNAYDVSSGQRRIGLEEAIDEAKDLNAHQGYDNSQRGKILPSDVSEQPSKTPVRQINASDINTDTAMGMDSSHFWDHHGNTKQDYMNLAEKLPEIQDRMNNGETFEQIKNDPQLHDAAMAYYDPNNMVQVEQRPDGGYDYIDNGRHRIAAAQELGYDMPVRVQNAQTTEQEAAPEEAPTLSGVG